MFFKIMKVENKCLPTPTIVRFLFDTHNWSGHTVLFTDIIPVLHFFKTISYFCVVWSEKDGSLFLFSCQHMVWYKLLMSRSSVQSHMLFFPYPEPWIKKLVYSQVRRYLFFPYPESWIKKTGVFPEDRNQN